VAPVPQGEVWAVPGEQPSGPAEPNASAVDQSTAAEGHTSAEPAAGDAQTTVAPAAAGGSEGAAAGHGAEPRGKRSEQGEATYLIAIAEALWEEMERDERVFLLGEDIGVYGGAFKVTEGFIERFGSQRVMDTPIAEDTIVGMTIGAAMEGFRPVAEFQYADFMSSGFDEITTTLGRYHYRTGVPLPVVLRGPSGGGVRASNFHSTNPEPWFAHAPGLKVICPAFPSDAKGLLKSAIRDDNPCVFLEHKWIYRRIKEKVSDDPDFTVPIGKAAVKREGTDLTIVTYGAMVHKALEAADDLARDGVSTEVVDLRTVYPLDEETVIESVAKTGRVLVLYESLRFLGIGAEVAAVIGEKAFEHLDAPIVRLAPPDTPVPFSPTLEDAFLPQVQDIVKAATRLSAW
jgi:2-oxoisovalerate dehydrogenase E1 component beta subunit